MNNTKRKNYNINTEDIRFNNNINNHKQNFETKTLKRKIRKEKNNGYEKNTKLIHYIHCCESKENLKNMDLPFQNNFYHEIGNKPYNNQNDENDKNNDINIIKSNK